MTILRTKTQKRMFILLGLLLVFIFSCSRIVEASAKIETAPRLLKDSYVLENMRCYIDEDGKGFFSAMFGDGFNGYLAGAADTIFYGTNLIYQVFDLMIEKLYSMNILAELNTVVCSLTNNLWTTLKQNYVTFILIIGLFSVAQSYFLNGLKEALAHLGKILLVLVVSGIWFPNASSYLTKINDLSFEMQASLLQVASQTDETSAIYSTTDKANHSATVNDSGKVATKIIRNELFRQALYRPFLLMNYGTTDASKINHMYEKVKDKEIPKNTNGDYLIGEAFDQLKADKKMKTIQALAEHNKYLTGDKAGYKLTIAFGSLFSVFLVGIPIGAIACLNMFLQLLAILYQYILPIIAIISLFPRYSNGLVSSIGNVIKLFFFKAILALAVIMFCLINTTIDLLIVPNSVVTVLTNIAVKGLVYYLLWHFRDWIIRSLIQAITGHGGNVKVNMRQLTGGATEFFEQGKQQVEHIHSNVQDMAQDTALLMAGFPGSGGIPSDFFEKGEPEIYSSEKESMDHDFTDEEEVEGEFTEIDDTKEANDSEAEGMEEEIQVVETPELDEISVEEFEPEEVDVAEIDVDKIEVEEVEPETIDIDENLESMFNEMPMMEGEFTMEEPNLEDIQIDSEGRQNMEKSMNRGHTHTYAEEQTDYVSENQRLSNGSTEEQRSNMGSSSHETQNHSQYQSNEAKRIPKQTEEKANKMIFVQQIRQGDVHNTQNNTQNADINVHSHVTNRVKTSDFDRLLKKYRNRK